MATLSEWMNRLRHLGRRSQFDDDLNVEVRFHIESRIAELIAEGHSPRDAATRARAEFGSTARAVEDSRAAWQFNWIEDLLRDLWYGLRALRRSPGFAATAVLSLALGIGANAAIFNALYSALWKPLPVSKPDQLVKVSLSSDSGLALDVPMLEFVRQLRSADVFEGVAVTSADGLSFSHDGRDERVLAEVVSGNYFDLLGVRPIIGQPFTPEVRRGDWAAEAVLSHGFWQRQFGGDPSVIGRTVRLNTYPFIITGVSPPGFVGLERGTDIDVRISLLPDGQELAQIAQIGARPDRALGAIARLKPNSSLAQATAAADAQFTEFLRATPSRRYSDRGIQHVRLVPLGRGDSAAVVRQLHTPLYVLFVLVALVLLVACANVANILLARASARARELAVRMSIGAGRVRLIRQMLAESLLLSLLAGALAVVIGNWVTGSLVHFVPQGHVALDLRMDAVTVLFVFALSLAACVTFGLAPAIRGTRFNLVGMLKADSRGSTGDLSSSAVRKMLVVSQVAVSLILLIAAGVFVRTMLVLWPTEFGAHAEQVLLLTMKPQQEIYTPVQRRDLMAEIVRRVSDMPGVDAAGVAEYGPLGSRTSERQASIELQPGHVVLVDTDWISEGFLEAAGIPRIAGRDFTASDRLGAPPVVIVNQSLARELFGNGNPLGRSIRLTEDTDARSFEIVGVVGDSRYYDVRSATRPSVWFAFQDTAPYMPTLHVRSSRVNTDALAAAVRRELDGVDKGFPIFNLKTLQGRMEESLARERILASLSGLVGLLALALAGVGLYGILAYSVAQRTREIGLRIALGSSVRAVLWMVSREALVLIGVGSAAGVALAFAGWRFLSARMPGVSTIDAQVLAVCATTMLVLAVAAVSIPAVRACRINPLKALRQE